MLLRRPLEVWLPSRVAVPLAPPVLEDVLRGYSEYRGDWLVDLSPRRRDGVVRRGAFPYATLSLLASSAMTVEVFHVGRNGYAWGPSCTERFPDSRVHGLLDQWMQLDARSLRPVGSSQPWPEPFARLFPKGGPSPDVHLVHANMVALGKSSQHPMALLQATSLAVPYVVDGYAFYLQAEFGPTWIERGRGPMWFELEGKGRVPREGELHRALQQAYPQLKDPKLRKELSRDPWRTDLLFPLVPVRRCWGVPGLLWALLIDRLEQGRGFETCRYCGWLLPGSRTQCGLKDNLDCYHAQAARRQREKRDRDERRSTRGRGDT
jgi:hypothetical protein